MNTPAENLDFEAMELEDLVSVAGDAGVDPEIARLAKQEMQSRTKRRRGLLGSGGTQSVQRTLNMILTEEAWEQMVEQAQSFVRKTGIPRVKGATREWTCSYEIGSLTMSATAAGAKTYLKLDSIYNGALRLAWMMGPLVGAIAGGLVGRAMYKPGASKTLPIFLGVAVGLVFILATYSAIRGWEARHRPKLLALMNLIAAKLDALGQMPRAVVDDTEAAAKGTGYLG